jgi:hypothetical protein
MNKEKDYIKEFDKQLARFKRTERELFKEIEAEYRAHEAFVLNLNPVAMEAYVNNYVLHIVPQIMAKTRP